MMAQMIPTVSRTPRPLIRQRIAGVNKDQNEVTAMTATRALPLISRIRTGHAALMLAALTLAGCAQPMMRTPTPGAVAAPAAVPAPAAPAPTTPVIAPVIAPVAPVQPPAPAAPSGPVDVRSGLHQAAVVSIAGSADSRFTVLFRPALTEPTRIEGAPAQICRNAGRELKTSRTNKPGSSSAMPGVQVMVVECTAA